MGLRLRRALGTHFVTLWLLPNIHVLNQLNEQGSYPRKRQTLPPQYQHLNSTITGYPANFQQLANNLLNNEGTGEMSGIYLGWSDIVAFREPFEFEVPQSFVLNPAILDQLYPINKEGPVIALGAANLTYHFDKHYIKKLFNQIDRISSLWLNMDNKMQFDWEKLQWKWVACTFPGLKAEGMIQGRIVAAEPNPETGNEMIEHIHVPLPLQSPDQAKQVYAHNGVPEIGLNHRVEAVVGETVIASAVADANGRFTLPIPSNHFGHRIILRSPAGGGRAQGEHSEGWPTAGSEIILTPNRRMFENAIIPKSKQTPGEPELVIVPHEPAAPHTASLQPPFGGLPESVRRGYNNQSVEFDVIKWKRVTGTKRYHIFFYHPRHGLLSAAQLNQMFGIMPTQIYFSSRNKNALPQTYRDNFDFLYSVADTRISIKYNCNQLAPGAQYQTAMILAFVSVQQNQLSAPDQAAMDKLMFQHVIEHNNEKKLKNHGILDFNFKPILIQPQPVRG